MIRNLSLYTGLFVAGLGLLGLITGEGQIASANIDLPLDLTRIALGSLLAWSGTRSVESAKGALTIFGVAYLGMFFLGMISPDLWGVLPSRLGITDHVLHLGGGIASLILAASRENRFSLRT